MNRFKQRRESLGLTAEKVASEMGVTVGTLYSWERGETQPHLKNIAQLAKLYNVSIDWLAGNDED